jgi:transcriptional regulator with XRE-family HTH domain
LSSTIHSYIRTHRRKWALTQKELAFLLGRKSSTHVSKLEQAKRTPTVDIIIACEIIFGMSSGQLLPKLYEEVEGDVMARAAELYEKIDGKKSRAAARKKELLSAVLNRAITRLITTEGE